MANKLEREAKEQAIADSMPCDTSSQISKDSRHSQRSSEVGQDDLEEFGEADIWDVGVQNVEPDDPPSLEIGRVYTADDEGISRTFSNRRRFNLDMEKNRGLGFTPSSRWNSSGRTASRNIPHAQPGMGAADHGPLRPLVQSSAPVNIPDWSKILGERDKATPPTSKPKASEEEDDGGVLIPPHLVVQRQSMRENDGLAMSLSVCEGAGRTLKGRDQKRVRNAVLRRTGFLEVNNWELNT